MKKVILVTLAILATIGSYANDAKKEFTKTMNKSFSVSNNPNLQVDNSFGEVKLVKGTSGSIEVDVLITVSAKNQEKADKAFDKIHVRLDKTMNGVRANTEIGNRDSWFDSWSFSWSSDDNNFSVDYTIRVPENTSIELANQHGDIVIETNVAKAEIDLQFGDLTALNFQKNLDLELAHGGAKLEDLKNADVEVNFGDFKCNSVDDLIIRTQHSDVYVTSANDIKAETGFGDYVIGTVNSLYNDGSHSDFEITSVGEISAESSFTYYTLENVNTSFNIENEHGDVKIKELSDNFKQGYVETSFGDVSIITDNYIDLTIEGSFVSTSLPKNFEIKTKIIEDHDTDINGKFNAGSGTMGKIKIDLEHGSFKIK